MIESFITSNNNTNNGADSTISIFIAIGTMFLSLFIGGILAWSYYATDKNQYLFITVLSVFIFIYSIVNMSYSILNKDILDVATYNIIFGSSIYIIFMLFFIIIIFSIKAFSKQAISASNDDNRYY